MPQVKTIAQKSPVMMVMLTWSWMQSVAGMQQLAHNRIDMLRQQTEWYQPDAAHELNDHLTIEVE